jgi:hypothetical protein
VVGGRHRGRHGPGSRLPPAPPPAAGGEDGGVGKKEKNVGEEKCREKMLKKYWNNFHGRIHEFNIS